VPWRTCARSSRSSAPTCPEPNWQYPQVHTQLTPGGRIADPALREHIIALWAIHLIGLSQVNVWPGPAGGPARHAHDQHE
jgi:hypothetical protein